MKTGTYIVVIIGMLLAVFTAFGITGNIPWAQIEPSAKANASDIVLPIVIGIVAGTIYLAYYIIDKLLN